MDAIEGLIADHRLIEQSLSALDGYVGCLTGKHPVPGDLCDFVEFIREFADGLHHRKEEGMLFATMVQHGFPASSGPIAQMLSEHDEGRRLVAVMASVARLPPPWSEDDRHLAATAATSYTALLRAHIYKEDNVLFKMARMHIPQAALQELDELVARFEGEQRAKSERLRAIARRLATVYVSSPGETQPLGTPLHAFA